MPVGWETHSTPEMGDRAQAIINKQVLADCDLLVAIFWTRIGSPTGVAPSGTVEEIEEHLAAGKPALIYFSTAPVRLDSVDNDQYSALQQFKVTCRSRGLIEEYDDLSLFREKFARHLAQTIIRLFANDTLVEDDIPQSNRKEPLLSVAAQELLYEASNDTSGTIIQIGTLDGYHIQSNGREFIESENARSEAKWRAAIDELENKGLIEDRAGKSEVFFVTDSGYEAVDILGEPKVEALPLAKCFYEGVSDENLALIENIRYCLSEIENIKFQTSLSGYSKGFFDLDFVVDLVGSKVFAIIAAYDDSKYLSEKTIDKIKGNISSARSCDDFHSFLVVTNTQLSEHDKDTLTHIGTRIDFNENECSPGALYTSLSSYYNRCMAELSG